MKTSSFCNSSSATRWAQAGRHLPVALAVMATVMAAWSANGQSPVTVTLNPSADPFVRSADATHNYGGAGALSVSGSAAVNGSGVQNGLYDSLMRFSLGSAVSSFDTAFGAGNWTPSSVTLARALLSSPQLLLLDEPLASLDRKLKQRIVGRSSPEGL